MCGIAGFLQADLVSERWSGILAAMGEALAHRGPDDASTWFDARAGVGLSFRRLAILDVSPRGRQPMASRDGRFRIIFNGEIYNFHELRTELIQRGHMFQSQSDTEVILAAFCEWGVAATLPRLNGMFAMAVWDTERRRLVLARDRFGEKPLYYGWMGRSFLFGSELKALRQHPVFEPEIDRRALVSLLRLGYIPSPESIYRRIAKLPPASVLEVDPSRPGALDSPRRFWDLMAVAREGLAGPLTAPTEEILDRLDQVLRRSVSLRMISDVPLGAFLSGGIDSSLVVAMMQAQSDRPVRTFTIGFREEDFDEAPYARAVAKHLGTDHRELYLSADDALAVVPRLATMYDEPFADSSQIPTFLVSQLARSEVTVVLSGDGGDELFAGYKRYGLTADLWRMIGWLPLPLRRTLAAMLRRTPAGAVDGGLGWLEGRLERYGRRGPISDRLKKLAEVLGARDADHLYVKLIEQWRQAEEIVLGLDEPVPEPEVPDLSGLDNRMMGFDQETYLPEDLLVKLDRAAMAVSLEPRVPLLDPDVADLAWRVPLSLKRRGGSGKWILRQLLRRYLPSELFERPKRGFALPLGEWLTGPFRQWAEALFDPRRLGEQGYLAPEPIARKWQLHTRGGRDFRYELWTILIFQQWLEQGGDRKIAIEPTRRAESSEGIGDLAPIGASAGQPKADHASLRNPF